MEIEEKVEIDQRKIFIGGIPWGTYEDRLKEHFGSYGVVDEVVIMRDRTTGRPRGFGFVVFADLAVVERVIKEKHVFDGRTVEAKKAIPIYDQHLIKRNINNIQGSPKLGRTKKIFVGGLASSVTDNDFKNYFDQFGSITNVIVMYNHNTQKPRGFGFVTYDSKDAVDMVLEKPFHELNGKMVEVKRALPKKLSPGPSQSSLDSYSYGLSRTNSLFNNYAQLYNLSSVGGYGARMDGRYSPLANSQANFSPFDSPAYGMGVNMEQDLTAAFFGKGSNFSNNLGYGSVLNPYYASNQSKYNIPIEYNASSNRDETSLNLSFRNMWGNGDLNTSPNKASSALYFNSGGGGFRVFGNNGANWDTNLIGGSLGETSGGHNMGNFNYKDGENNHYVGAGGFGRNTRTCVTVPSSFATSTGHNEISCGEFYHNGSVYGDSTWQTTSAELDNSSSFSYGLGNREDNAAKESEDYVVNYDIPNTESSKGVAT